MRKLFALLALAAAVACGGDKATNPASDSIAGTFALQSVNGSPLPYTIQSGSTSVTITSDVLTVADGGSWSETYAYRQTVNGSTTNQTGTDAGTWSRSGTGVSFYSNVSASNAYTGTFTGSGFNLSDGTYAFIFLK